MRYVDPTGHIFEDIIDVFKGFLRGIGSYITKSIQEETPNIDEIDWSISEDTKEAADNHTNYRTQENIKGYMGDSTEDAASYIGYQAVEWVDNHNIYTDITITFPDPITGQADIAIGKTTLTGNENYENARYIHVGPGYSITPIDIIGAPSFSLSYSIGIVSNADKPKDFSGSFVSGSANLIYGVEHARWYSEGKLVSSTGITVSTTPSIGVRYDWYELIDYTDPVR